MKELYIIGTGSQARYVIETCNTHPIKGLIDILKRENIGKTVNDIKIIGFLDDIGQYVDKEQSEIIIAYGENKVKKEIAEMLTKAGYNFATIISTKAYISAYTEIGKGCIINPNVTVMPNSKIGSHVIIHSGSVIEHDNEIGDYANIAPGVTLAGNVKIGKGSYVYTGATIIPKVKIGDNVIIGAGAVVLEDIIDNAVAIGIPAKVIKYNQN